MHVQIRKNVLENKTVTLTGERLALLCPVNTEPHPPSPRQCNSSYLASNAAVTKKQKQTRNRLSNEKLVFLSQLKINMHDAFM